MTRESANDKKICMHLHSCVNSLSLQQKQDLNSFPNLQFFGSSKLTSHPGLSDSFQPFQDSVEQCVRHGTSAGTLAPANPTCSGAALSSQQSHFPAAQLEFLTFVADPEAAVVLPAAVAAAAVVLLDLEFDQEEMVLALLPGKKGTF